VKLSKKAFTKLSPSFHQKVMKSLEKMAGKADMQAYEVKLP